MGRETPHVDKNGEIDVTKAVDNEMATHRLDTLMDPPSTTPEAVFAGLGEDLGLKPATEQEREEDDAWQKKEKPPNLPKN